MGTSIPSLKFKLKKFLIYYSIANPIANKAMVYIAPA